MRTYGEYNGVPVGNYQVIVNKEENVYDNSVPPQIKESFNLIEKKYNAPHTTDLTVEVKPDTKSVELKVGKAVREAIARVPG